MVTSPMCRCAYFFGQGWREGRRVKEERQMLSKKEEVKTSG